MFDLSLTDIMIPAFSFSFPYFSFSSFTFVFSPFIFFFAFFFFFFPYLNDVVTLHEANPLNLVRLRGTVSAFCVIKRSHARAQQHGCHVPFGS